MQKCPKCNKAYDDAWKICLTCNLQLIPTINDVPARKSIQESSSEDPVKKKISRAKAMLNIGIGMCAFSLIYAIAGEGFGFNILTQKFTPNFKFHGVASLYGIALTFCLPYGVIGFVLFYLGKRRLPKNIILEVLFWILFSLIIVGFVVLFHVINWTTSARRG